MKFIADAIYRFQLPCTVARASVRHNQTQQTLARNRGGILNIALAFAVLTGCCANGYGQSEAAEAKSEQIQDLNALIDSLANRNEQPKIVKLDGKDFPLFANSYDWTEQRRVNTVLHSLAKEEGEDLWPLLVEHLDDKRYSLTFSTGFPRHIRNCSVGNLCYWIALQDLELAYVNRLPGAVEHLRQFSSPDELKKWFDERNDKPLHVLQIEMCEWAVQEMSKMDRLTEKEKTEFAAKIDKQVDKLRATEMPEVRRISVLAEQGHHFFGEKEAAEIRNKHAAEQGEGHAPD